MTAQEIRQSFNMIKTPNALQYCQGLNKILTFIKANKITESAIMQGVSIDGGAHVFTDFQLESAYRRKFPEKKVPSISDMQNELEIAQGVLISFKINTGNYSFCVPTNNEFYHEICAVLNIPIDRMTVKKEVVHTFVTSPTLCENIKTAIKFVSINDWRPAMQCILLQFANDGVNVVSTDTHILYESKCIDYEAFIGKGFKRNAKELQILIAPEGLKTLKAMKIDYDNPLNIKIFDDDTMSINGIEIPTMAGVSFPNYKPLMQGRDGLMEFEKDILVQKVKYVLPCANKATSQVSFHLNGSIDLKSCDIDYEFEAKTTMPYITKNFKDMDISFNGKQLIKCLSVLKGKNIKLHSTGESKSAVLLTNDIDTMLLMPLLID